MVPASASHQHSSRLCSPNKQRNQKTPSEAESSTPAFINIVIINIIIIVVIAFSTPLILTPMALALPQLFHEQLALTAAARSTGSAN